ncbi:HD domain-containing protein [Occallatibacter riparius]|uniref:HD domain-containing protein n=1 Tax=Occallatibacter riparius TaxID=1002689 RepID=A0A9J7BX85_9BACT|nr:HD domain-containing protein [Occallatibacter riparius]UWZ85717.1 HD domain-containing protein [Occallatibacter riparius]
MGAQDWRQAVIEYIRAEAAPQDKFGHQPRLYELAIEIGQGTDFDDDIVFAAAWMHDLGVFLGHRPADPEELACWNHVPYTIAKCRELLPAWGFPAEKVEAVAEAIRTHQPQDAPAAIEAILLRDADILEQLGAVGVLRAVVKVGRDSRYRNYSDVVPVLRRAVEKLPEKIRLPRARQLAEPKIAAMRAFLEAIESEAGELLF